MPVFTDLAIAKYMLAVALGGSAGAIAYASIQESAASQVTPAAWRTAILAPGPVHAHLHGRHTPDHKAAPATASSKAPAKHAASTCTFSKQRHAKGGVTSVAGCATHIAAAAPKKKAKPATEVALSAEPARAYYSVDVAPAVPATAVAAPAPAPLAGNSSDWFKRITDVMP